MNKKIISIILLAFVSFAVYADDPHYGDRYKASQVINNYSSETVVNQMAKREVRAAAAGQTNYKASPRIQWNMGAAFVDSESALNFGLGAQLGSIFVTGGITDNVDTMFTKDSDPLITINASGVF